MWPQTPTVTQWRAERVLELSGVQMCAVIKLLELICPAGTSPVHHGRGPAKAHRLHP